MMYNTISAKAIVGSTMSSFGLKDTNYLYDALEWIGDGIAAIGYHIGLINKVELVEVDNGTIIKPCDFYQLNAITHNGHSLSYGRLQRSSNSQVPLGSPLLSELERLITARNESVCNADGIVYGEDTLPCDADETRLLDGNMLERIDNQIKHAYSGLGSVPVCQEHYFINSEGNCFKTSIECGTVLLFYKAYPVDSEGYPLVIDEYKYKDALEYVVMERLMRGGLRHPVLSYQEVKAEKDFKIARARNEHNKFTHTDMKDFANKWTNQVWQLYNGNNPYSNGT